MGMGRGSGGAESGPRLCSLMATVWQSPWVRYQHATTLRMSEDDMYVYCVCKRESCHSHDIHTRLYSPGESKVQGFGL